MRKPAGDNAILVVPGANQRCDVEYLQQNRDLFLHSDIVLLQMEIPRESVFYAVRLARELGKTVILNPAPAPEGLPEDIYGALDLITPNETEFKQLTGCPTDQVEDILLYSRRILDKGTKHVLVTLGSPGRPVYRAGGPPALPRRQGHRGGHHRRPGITFQRRPWPGSWPTAAATSRPSSLPTQPPPYPSPAPGRRPPSPPMKR